MDNKNGVTPDVRHVPLYMIPPDRQGKGNTGEVVSQLQTAPTIYHLLGIPPCAYDETCGDCLSALI